ncbi:protein NinF [Erwinia billingiae]|uniref:protein NinF n=1 Tax=Erwinia billingiae TaxID=182337 RepID=UPI003BAEF194
MEQGMSEPYDRVCAECGRPLSEDEAHCCDDCAAWMLEDPNANIAGGYDGNSHQAAEET